MRAEGIARSWRGTMKLLGATLVLLLCVGARPAGAQTTDVVFGPNELSKLPKVSAPGRVQSLIANSYPETLRSRGVGGTVQVQFVVGADGKVEAGSIRIVASTVPELAEAAEKVVAKLEFSPGEKDGTPVRTRVLLPIAYSAQ